MTCDTGTIDYRSAGRPIARLVAATFQTVFTFSTIPTFFPHTSSSRLQNLYNSLTFSQCISSAHWLSHAFDNFPILFKLSINIFVLIRRHRKTFLNKIQQKLNQMSWIETTTVIARRFVTATQINRKPFCFTRPRFHDCSSHSIWTCFCYS